jgi:hypothetical protein
MATVTLNPPPQESATPGAGDDEVIVDSLGRKLVIKEPEILQESRLARVLGGDTSINAGYMMGYVVPACMVTSIDGQPLVFPMSQGEVDIAITRLGRAGLGAVMSHLIQQAKDAQSRAEEIKK